MEHSLQAWHEGNNDVQYRYYYQTITTGIKNIAGAAGSISVYPVPAQTALTISLSWNEPQAFTIGIYDIQGRLVKQWPVAAAKEYQQRIPVMDIPAGSYIIKATGTQQQMTRQIMIAE